MKNIVEEIQYERIGDFLHDTTSVEGKLFNVFYSFSKHNVSSKYIFRGQPSSTYGLIPSSLRKENKQRLFDLSGHEGETELDQMMCERILLKKFFQKCNNNGLSVPKIDDLQIQNDSSDYFFSTWLPDNYFELAGLAQHYGLPTRLLDWTSNFLVALYFAIQKGNLEDEYCSVWALNYSAIRDLPSSISSKIKVIVPEYSMNQNLQAQKGVLMHCQKNTDVGSYNNPVDRRSLDEIINESREFIILEDNCKLFYKINIPLKFSKEIYIYLSAMGIDGSTLFPGYAGVTKSINEDADFL